MGRLKIEKILYDGDNYYFKSPIFEDGINIIEGTNGSGKSTFSNLISFVLGNYVKEFDKKKKSKVHTQIVNDTNNYVAAIISINEQRYKIKRFFNNNSIFIEDKNRIKEYPIYRSSSEVEIFSDWLLNKLGFSIVEIYQGTVKSKLNFSDLFRLIYYDQKTVPEKIYKDSRNDRNFVSDSDFIRKVIFQMLMGHEFSEYYQIIGQLNQYKKELNNFKVKEEGFLEISSEFGFKDLSAGSLDELKKEIEQIELQLKRLEKYEEQLMVVDEEPIDTIEKVRQLKKRLVDIELSIEDRQNKINRIYKEINSILSIKEDIILEVTQIKKIILTHEELNLFSPNTCPYCLNKAERTEGHCICGKEIDENEYEKFFYSSDEYLTILKSKQKSIETLDLAIQSCEEELGEIKLEITNLQAEREKLQNLVNEVKDDVQRNTNFVEVKDIQYKKYSLKEKVNHLKQNYKVKENFDNIQKDILTTKSSLEKKNVELKEKKEEATKEIKKQIIRFNEIYSKLMIDIKEDINKARISEDNYMPIINDGEYKEASVDVSIRLMYFLTLLKLSLLDSKIPFPRFLLIDTPESLGIDKDDLEKSISKFLTDNKKDKNTVDKFQIILTTGVEKYPEEFSVYKRGRSLSKKDRLLIKKN